MNTILIEQDFNSPHRYIDEEFNVDQDETVFDIGAADGNFSLEVVDRCDKIFLFESNTQWISPLSKTFENYGDKVEIINKKAGDKNDKSTVKIDSIVGEVKNNLFFKIDVDGFEREVLKGMCNILRSAVGLKIAICTYHNQDDAVEFEIFFKNLGFETSFTPGVMLFHYDKKIRKPFFRKGVLKAYKPENRDKKS
ncbi:FkbM family methyltransferase [Negadavirga shengliensis]|uniref:FkbM family methyltransferase n=1 Tax=Negadavirga shengliensis TaxID=1389218 RepID=A0ABV9T655_9BACT